MQFSALLQDLFSVAHRYDCLQKETTFDGVFALKPIFVVGAPRSGTTLVGKILGQQTQVFSPGESHYFEDIWSRRKDLGQLKTASEISVAASRLMTIFQRYNFPDAQQFVNSCVDPLTLVQQTLDLQSGYGALYSTFMMMLAGCAGKTRICDDTPKHLYYVPDILQLFPDAKFVGCVRDPRDFLFSYRNYWRRSTESARIKALYHPVMTSMLWQSSTKASMQYSQQLGPAKMMLVQYEKLVENPEKIVRELCQFLNVEFEPDMLQIESNNSSFTQNSTGIFSTSVGRWRTGLPAEDTWWCQYLNQKYMAEFAMQQEYLNVSKIGLLGVFASTPTAFIRALKANQEKRGPLLSYLVRRLRSLS